MKWENEMKSLIQTKCLWEVIFNMHWMLFSMDVKRFDALFFLQQEIKSKQIWTKNTSLLVSGCRQTDLNRTEIKESLGPYLVSSSVFSRTACAIVSASWYFFLLLVSSFTESCSSAWIAVSWSMHWRRATNRTLHLWKLIFQHLRNMQMPCL